MYNIVWSTNAKNQKDSIEKEGVLKNLLQKIDDVIDFIQKNPTDINGATRKGFNPLQLSENTYTFHLTKANDFTYTVSDNNIIIVSIRDSHKNVSLYTPEDYPDLMDIMRYINEFFYGDMSYRELIKRCIYYQLRIEAVDSSKLKNVKEAMNMMKRLKAKAPLPADIVLFSIVINKERIFISRSDAMNLRFAK